MIDIAHALEAKHKQIRIFLAVFSSTVNVVFRGQEIINGTEESHLWIDNGGHLDYYSHTKHLAEKLVIEANGQNNKLKTCVLR